MNITVTFQEYGVEFSSDNGDTAILQLPNTPDSQDSINGIDESEWADTEHELYQVFKDYFYNDLFSGDHERAAASTQDGACRYLAHLENVELKDKEFYVGFDENGGTHVLVENPHKSYYNKAYLFSKAQYDDFICSVEDEEQGLISEDDIIAAAKERAALFDADEIAGNPLYAPLMRDINELYIKHGCPNELEDSRTTTTGSPLNDAWGDGGIGDWGGLEVEVASWAQSKLDEVTDRLSLGVSYYYATRAWGDFQCEASDLLDEYSAYERLCSLDPMSDMGINVLLHD